MLPPIPSWLTSIEIAAPTVIAIVALSRLYFGGVVFAPRYTRVWNIVRRIAAPLLQRLIYQNPIIPNVEIENQAVEAEYVGVVARHPTDVALDVDNERDVEIPLLAGFKTDWEGNTEVGTFVWYCGSRPAGLPEWLKKYQVHATLFRVEGGYRMTAHREANPWRLDLALDHLTKGPSFSAEDGVQRTKRALRDAGVPITETRLEA